MGTAENKEKKTRQKKCRKKVKAETGPQTVQTKTDEKGETVNGE